MTDISIGTGQGVTQAIASNLGLSKDDCKKIKLSTWQSVMSLVDEANTKSKAENNKSIFGGNNNVQGIGDKSTWKDNFKVQAGQTMLIDDNIFSKIKQLLTSSGTVKAKSAVSAPETSTVSETEETSKTSAAANTASTQKVTGSNGVYKTDSPTVVADTPLEGDVQTGRAVSDALDSMLTDEAGEITVTSDEWRKLAAKPNKTSEEIQQLDTEYATNMKKVGNSMAKYISETFAAGGDIDTDAFMKFQNSELMNLGDLTAAEKQQLDTSNQIAFNRIDQNQDGKIDSKEMSAFMMSLDFNEKNQMGGIISADDYKRTASQLDDPNENLLDKKLAYSYNKLYGNE